MTCAVRNAHTASVGRTETSTILERWGARIRQRREELNRSQAWLAEECGVLQTTVSRWEAGDIAPTIDKQVVIAQVLGLPWAELFSPIEVAS